MPFVRMKGCEMLVYVPEEQPASQKKHNCKDCYSCQWCSDERCRLCLTRKKSCRKK